MNAGLVVCHEYPCRNDQRENPQRPHVGGMAFPDRSGFDGRFCRHDSSRL